MSRATRFPVLTAVLATITATALVATGNAGPGTEDPGHLRSYVVSAPGTWGTAETDAVTRAGGAVLYQHGPTGMAVVESGSGSFVKNLQKIGMQADLDMVIDWQKPLPTSEIELGEEAVTPGNETFINEQWNIQAIQAPAAWAAPGGYTGLGVRVAILDGGIHSTHIDLAGNLDVARSTSFVPGQNFNQDVGTFWHGTHVAGIVAAADNGIGTIGVAPAATLIGVKVLHSGSGSFGQVIAGILYASDPIADGGAGADIINMSLGAAFARGGGNTGAGPLVAAMNKAVNYATGRGVLVVCSAGNDALDLDHTGSVITVPAQSGTALAVSATGPVGYAVGWPSGAMNFRRPASYTNYGNSAIHLAAPGGDFALPGSALCSIPRCCGGPPVTTFCWVHDMVMSTTRGSGASISTYGWAAGTSMAAPAVAGVAALVKQRFPGISVGDLKNFLAQTADDEGAVGHDPYYGRGFVNAYRAVTEGGSQAQPLAQAPVELALRGVTTVPNPARTQARLRFSLPGPGQTSLSLYDTKGRRVRVLANGWLEAGDHSALWDMRDEANRLVPPGLYFTTLSFRGQTTSGRLVVIP